MPLRGRGAPHHGRGAERERRERALRLTPPPPVRDIVRTLEQAGHQAWCVGGAVRDALLGIPSLDWDVATSATPEQVQRLFRRTVPVGLAFGTVGVLDRDGVLHEVTTFRHDVRTDGRHAEVAFGASLEEDLARRDFTINAIAVHPETGEVRDPFGGRADLGARRLRAVGDPAQRMVEDRLRALRAIRFAARFDLVIDPATWDAIVASGPFLGRLSRERIKQELEKVMEQVALPSRALRHYRDGGVFAAVIPTLAEVSDRRLVSVDRLAAPGAPGRPDRRLLRMAALFAASHDVEEVLRGLRFANADVRAIGRWTGALAQLLPSIEALGGREPDAASLRRWVATAGRTGTRAVARLALAWLGSAAESAGGAGAAARAGRRAYRSALRTAWRDPIEIADLAVDGEDLRRAGVPAGPSMGAALQRLLEAVLEDPSRNRRETLLAMLP